MSRYMRYNSLVGVGFLLGSGDLLRTIVLFALVSLIGLVANAIAPFPSQKES